MNVIERIEQIKRKCKEHEGAEAYNLIAELSDIVMEEINGPPTSRSATSVLPVKVPSFRISDVVTSLQTDIGSGLYSLKETLERAVTLGYDAGRNGR